MARFKNRSTGENIFKIMALGKHELAGKDLSRIGMWDAWSGNYERLSLDIVLAKFNAYFNRPKYRKRLIFAIFKQVPAKRIRKGRKTFKWVFIKLI